MNLMLIQTSNSKTSRIEKKHTQRNTKETKINLSCFPIMNYVYRIIETEETEEKHQVKKLPGLLIFQPSVK